MIKKCNFSSMVLGGLLATASVVCCGSMVFADGETIDEVFTDEAFLSCVVDAYKTINPTASVTETSALEDFDFSTLTSLECIGDDTDKIASVAGIGYLTALTDLNLSGNNLEGIGLANNLELKNLDLSNNRLAAIDLSANVALTSLDLTENDLTTLDLSSNSLLTVENVNVDNDVTVIMPEVDEPEPEPEPEPATCAPWVMENEVVELLRSTVIASGYDASGFNAENVKKVAYETNMCDGMSVDEARLLTNAMGVNLSDGELTELAELVTVIYTKMKDGATLEEIIAATSVYSGPLVPNTGVSTGEFNASVAVLSIGVVMMCAGAFYVARYGLKRHEAKVTFRR